MPNFKAQWEPFSIPDYRAAMRQMIRSIHPTHFVTFVFNRDTTVVSADKDLRNFQAWIDRRTIGRNWQKSGAKRCRYIGIIEHPNSNLHIHAAFVVLPCHWSTFEHGAGAVWNKLIPGGSIDVKEITDIAGAARYMAKAIAPATSELLLISEGFK